MWQYSAAALWTIISLQEFKKSNFLIPIRSTHRENAPGGFLGWGGSFCVGSLWVLLGGALDDLFWPDVESAEELSLWIQHVHILQHSRWRCALCRKHL